ncbi:MAG: 50S ribosomal protein L17 [Pseudomonadales bacterium]|nr:50S ribosomal protein L17 [Candidatus Woesebacteria bacterium]MCB9801733.1 50S ribosomal protein L17 [Pseudomonadales bacterium]
MRHRVQKKSLNRNTKQRKALFRSLVRSLLEHGSITTTKAKAKVLRPAVDKLLARATTASSPLIARRAVQQYFGKRDVANTVIDRVLPAFGDKKTGFTTQSVIGKRRGDNTPLVKVSLTSIPEITGTFKKNTTTIDSSTKAQR